MINKILIFLITGIRPLLGPAQCRYEISCTRFTVLQLQTKSLFPAVWISFKRILSCNPFMPRTNNPHH